MRLPLARWIASMSIPPTTWPDAPGIIGLVIVGFGHDQSATLLHRLVVALGLVLLVAGLP